MKMDFILPLLEASLYCRIDYRGCTPIVSAMPPLMHESRQKTIQPHSFPSARLWFFTAYIEEDERNFSSHNI
jgi:hypothetical protein